MSKKCARCEKTVYPIEELKCLDKIWHKQCFKCQVCNMTLNMRNYKGFDKQPYCEAHIPKVKATTMAETPELKRIAENTKIQSNVLYHAEFEKAKGKFTQVADDPETLRIKQNSKIISNVAYHGELEKKAQMEKQRLMKGENGEKACSEDGEDPAGRHLCQLEDLLPPSNHQHVPHVPHVPHVTPVTPPSQLQQPPPLQPQIQQPLAPQPLQTATAPNVPMMYSQVPVHQPGKISDYDPLSEQPRNSPYSARQSATLIYTSDRGPVTAPPTRPVGSIADLDPVNDYYGSLSADFRAQASVASSGNFVNNNHHPHQQTSQMSAQQNHTNTAQNTGRRYRALYDYDAQDEDEVSFRDGDLIINCTAIDEGWMTGLVQRTGRTGMLPANYVEPAN